MRTLRPLALLPLLLLATACTDPEKTDATTSAPKGTGFAYTDPTATGWRLVKAAGSDSTTLVLDLMGPTGVKARGVGLTLQSDATMVTYGKFPSGAYVEDAGVFNTGGAGEPQLVAAGVKNDRLMVGAFQKGSSDTSKDCGTKIFSVVVKFKAGSQGVTVPLKVLKAQIIPDDISTAAKRRMQDITVAVGTLTIK